MILESVTVDRLGNDVLIVFTSDGQPYQIMVPASTAYAIGRLITIRSDNGYKSDTEKHLQRLLSSDK